MPKRVLEVEVVADASQLERTFNRASRSAGKFDRNMNRSFRGVAAGSGVFQHLGRSLAFASTGFLAFESGSAFIRTSIDAAREAAVAQRSLAAQMKASGESFRANREQVDRVAESYARFGFNNDQVIQSLTVLERGTGRINTAIRLQGLTADIARAKNIDLAAAAAVVAKVFGGQETALRRAVPGLAKTAHGWDLIRLAQAKMAGQAAAGTTASERFNATLHNTEVIIGTALLPALNKSLTSLSKWLDKMNRTGKLQKDVADSAHVLAGAFNAVATAIGGMIDAYNKLPDFGKRKGLIDLLPGGRFSGLDLLHALGIGGRGGAGPVNPLANRRFNIFGTPYGPARPTPLNIPSRLGGTATGVYGTALTAAQKRAIALAGTPGIAALRAQVAYDKTALAFLEKRHQAGKVSAKNYTDQVVSLTNDLAQQTAAIQAILDTQTSAAKKHKKKVADKAKAAAKATEEAARGTVGALAIGFRATLQREDARRRTAAATAGQFNVPAGLDLGFARAQARGGALRPWLLKMRAAAERAIKSGRLTTQALTDAYNEIFNVNQQLKDLAKQGSDTYKQQRRRAVQLAHASGADYQLAYALGGPRIHIEHFHSSAANPRALEDQLVKRARARAHVRRGAR